MKTIHYVNLTNGIEALPLPDARFVRIRSTWCEQKRWADMIFELETDLLWNLAMGNRCLVYDFSNGARGVPRSIWQGLEWIRFVVSCSWGLKGRASVRGVDVTDYFSTEYRRLTDRHRKRISYFKKLLPCDRVLLEGIPGKTTHDGDFEHYSRLALLKRDLLGTSESADRADAADWVRGRLPAADAGGIADLLLVAENDLVGPDVRDFPV